MIKNLVLLPCILFLLSSCKYGSSFEAKEACEKWKKKGGEFSVSNLAFNGDFLNSFTIRLRTCRFDKLTNKYLGYEYKKLKKNKNYTPKEYNKEKRVVVKRFGF